MSAHCSSSLLFKKIQTSGHSVYHRTYPYTRQIQCAKACWLPEVHNANNVLLKKKNHKIGLGNGKKNGKKFIYLVVNI